MPHRRRTGCVVVAAALSPGGLGAEVVDDGSAAARGSVRGVSGLRFNVVYEDAGEGWVYARVSELPEVQTQGESLEQARAMVLDAIAMVLDERRARGELIPEPGWALVESVEIAA
jgi:predicted RNase H-like HicB family nuclease